VCAIAAFLLATPIICVFRKEDAEVVRIGTILLRCQSLTLPLFAVICANNMFSQTCGFGGRATFLSCLRNGVCLIPMLLILPGILGMTGLVIAQPIADVFSVIISVLMMRPILKGMRAQTEAVQ